MSQNSIFILNAKKLIFFNAVLEMYSKLKEQMDAKR
jgi:hypothetical protein